MQQFHSLVTRNTGWFHKKNPVFEQKLDKRSIFLKKLTQSIQIMQTCLYSEHIVARVCRNYSATGRVKMKIADNDALKLLHSRQIDFLI